MPTLHDELCPDYVGARRLVLALAPEAPSPRAFAPVDVTIDYSGAEPEGVVLPLEMTITSPSPSNFVRRILRRTRPSSLSFVPREGGRHLIRVAEVGHNRWFGALLVDVAGERTDPRA